MGSEMCIRDSMKKGEIVHMVERHEIEGSSPFDIAEKLKEAYNQHC